MVKKLKIILLQDEHWQTRMYHEIIFGVMDGHCLEPKKTHHSTSICCYYFL
ncbi:uncharacterized protein METZ01_LOCUS362789 [marine metagenome]|uniref:Uncharacterized protein n=1 Tax=marine metagenome TaxID=408172 RepID=A0A382SKC5_9ZZZZ